MTYLNHGVDNKDVFFIHFKNKGISTLYKPYFKISSPNLRIIRSINQINYGN